MSMYEQPAVWGVNADAVGATGLLRTAAPHLREGEQLLGVFAVDLDPLLPLYFYAERFKEQMLWLPFVLLWDVLRGVLAATWRTVAPEWLEDLFEGGGRYRRRYGLNPFRRTYRAIRRPLHGGSWAGGKESVAGQVWRAVRTTPSPYLRLDHDRFTLVLTDQLRPGRMAVAGGGEAQWGWSRGVGR